ncbi:PREDICTED: netrin receptor UNC5A-like [Priapulus caudatus]|uniref:Netrin receptor UNC5A-like n=1 Tax=Priapulus caudatus TaxID=37621 RepID=A0ABM1F536_PRICU|nr:PREDICTED: netrin receptor UNC5A-like [Priapulus caudatus]
MRTCTEPFPTNGGRQCRGESMQKSDCMTMCPVNGGWTSWADWSSCSPDCRQHRQRKCTNPSPANGGKFCRGEDFSTQNCTGSMCRDHVAEAVMYEDGDVAYWPPGKELLLYIGLGASALVFIVVVILIVCCLRRKARGDMDEEHYTNGVKVPKTNGYTPACSAVLSYEPDLTKNTLGVVPPRKNNAGSDYNYNEKPKEPPLNGILKNRDAER